MRCQLACMLYECEAAWSLEGRRSIHVWEPLDVDLPADARPHCYGLDSIDFWDAAGARKLVERLRHHDLGCAGGRPVLLRVGGTNRWWQVTSGSCVHRDGRWWMRWLCYDNTRAARDLNGERDGDYGIRPIAAARAVWWAWRWPSGVVIRARDGWGRLRRRCGKWIGGEA